MKNKIFKVGFGYLIIAIMVIGISIILVNNVDNQLQESTNTTQEEIPLQEAVGENKVETIQVAKAKTIKKKAVKKKKTTKKKLVKKKKKKKIRRITARYTRQSLGLNVKASKTKIIQYAHQLISSYGWGENEWQYIIKIANHESGWNGNAVNPSSGACGIPQALPCKKMKSAGKDYKTNYKTQVKWFYNYIVGRYKTPTRAWAFWTKHHWY